MTDMRTRSRECHFNHNNTTTYGSDAQTLNNQPWTYNTGTLNGGANTIGAHARVKAAAARRGGIPASWMNEPAHVSNLGLQQISQQTNGQYNPSHLQSTLPRSASPGDDELIPTAIVIKNIPFAVKKESLVDILCEKGLPLPYAFNYHFDNGIFRGLAFANFTTPDETSQVIAALNHLELNGRKLRVEYKKMLPAHERDRIERDKRERRGQLQEQHQPMNMQLSNNASQLHSQNSMNSLHSIPNSSSPSPLSTRGPVKPPLNVDLNNPATLNYFSEMNLLIHDQNRETVVFPAPIPPKDRRDIHEIAQSMGLYHKSDGFGDDRHVTVSKRKDAISPTVQAAPSYTWNSDQRRGLARAATIDFGEARENGHYNHHTLGRQASDLLNIPGSPGMSGLSFHDAHNLRAAKSFADLRSHTPSPARSTASFPVGHGQNVSRYAEYVQVSAASATPTLTPISGRDGNRDDPFLLNGMGALTMTERQTGSRTNLPGRLGQDRENYTSSAGPIGSQRATNGSFEDSARNGVSAVPERQPRGPGAEWGTTGFARPRQNGHVTRGSGELDLRSITKPFDDNNSQDSPDRNSTAPSRY